MNESSGFTQWQMRRGTKDLICDSVLLLPKMKRRRALLNSLHRIIIHSILFWGRGALGTARSMCLCAAAYEIDRLGQGVLQLGWFSYLRNQDTILVEFGCYQFQAKGLGTGIFIWPPSNFRSMVAFLVRFTADTCNLLLLKDGKHLGSWEVWDF
jgi:hypothetical protein